MPPAKAKPLAIYQLKATLRGSKPPIWRRVQVRSDTTLVNLHWTLQSVFNWDNSHLHVFRFGEVEYSDPDFELEEAKSELRLRLDKLITREGAKFSYTYDFGDNWDHQIEVEKILPVDPAINYPICLTGRQAGPPDDCGGVWGYYGMLEALADPKNPDHEMWQEWVEPGFDPNLFDLAATNAKLEPLRKQSRAR